MPSGENDFSLVVIGKVYTKPPSGTYEVLGSVVQSTDDRLITWFNATTARFAVDQTSAVPVSFIGISDAFFTEPMLMISSFDYSTATAKMRLRGASINATDTRTGTVGGQNGNTTLCLGSSAANALSTTSPDIEVLDVGIFNTPIVDDAELLSAIEGYATSRCRVAS
jgi:hypothetical protein